MIKIFLLLLCPALLFAQRKNKTVVLTFDDANQSHYSFIAPLLKQYKFGATFYVCEFPDFADSSKYMNWRQIQQLSLMGFEIGNHTWHHHHINELTPAELETELGYIENKCDSLHIPKPASFAYPGYLTDSAALPALRRHGYTTARTGGDRAYAIKKDNSLYVPSFTITGDDSAYFYKALQETGKGKAVVFTIHGVPDNAHTWVSTSQEVFKKYLQYLYDHHYRIIAMKDLHIQPVSD